jgi:signal transduction histidine kinase
MVFRLFLFLIAFLSFSIIVSAQPRQDLSWYLSFQTSKSGYADSAFEASQVRMQEAVEVNDLAAQAHEYKTRGMLYLTRSHNYLQALTNFLMALQIEDSLSYENEKTITYVAMAAVFEQVRAYGKSIEYLQKCVVRDISDRTLQVYVLNRMGKMLSADGKPEAALDNFEMVLELQDSLRSPAVKAEALSNTAQVLVQQRKWTEALAKYKESLQVYRSVNKRAEEAQSLNDIGQLYHLMNNIERALANHVAAIEIRQTLGDSRGLAESYNNASVLYYQQKNFKRALANLQLAIAAGNSVSATGEIRKSYEYIYLCYKELGDFQQALGYHEKYASFTDLLQEEKDAREVAEEASRFTISGVEQEIDKLETDRLQREKELAVQKQFQNILIVLIALIVVIAVLITTLYLSKRRSNKMLQAINERVREQNEQLQQLNATKDKFFSIISHDLKGPLNSLTSFSGLLINHTDKLSKEDIQMLATDLDKSVKNLFTLLENLLEWSRSQTGNIDFKAERFNLSDVLIENKALLTTQAQAKKIQIVFNDSNNPVQVYAHRNSITTVVRNLLSNAIKFTPEGGLITLHITRTHKFASVAIRDTGVGMSPEVIDKLFRIDTKHSTKGTANEKGTGLGLILCKDFIEKNGGSMTVLSELNKGSEFSFTVPIQ